MAVAVVMAIVVERLQCCMIRPPDRDLVVVRCNQCRLAF
jgi:hypothetical protein